MPDPREITATLVVGFGEQSQSDNDILIAEIDSREDGLNGGKTRFLPGEDVWILVYTSANVTLNTPVTSWGNLILRAGDELVDKEEDVQFVDEIEGQVGYPIRDGFTSQWIGTSQGNPVQTGEKTLQISQPAASHWARLLRVNWVSRARAYRLTNTFISGFDEYSIICHFTGTAI